MSKAMKLLRKVATGQFVELGSRVREEIVRRSEQRHHARNDDHFHPTKWKDIFTPQFLSQYSQSGDTGDLVQALRDKSPEKFFPGFDRPGDFRAFAEAHCRQEGKRILATAQQVLNDDFTIFNHTRLKLGDPPAWNLEARANILAPEKFYANIDYLNAEEVGDSKIVWEPSRLQFVYDLGQAHVLTGDERYPAHFFDLLNLWNRRNRDYHGINFCSALEFTFRANSVIWGLHFFRNSKSLNQQAARDVYRLLYISGRFMSNHLSRYFSPNTHLLGEAYGLFLIGLLFPEFQEAQAWRAVGQKIMSREIDQQIRADGMHAEKSTCYHAYSLEFVMSFLILSERNGITPEGHELTVFSKMTEALSSLQLPSGLFPSTADEDGGRLYFLTRPLAHDYRQILQAAEQYLGHEINATDRSPELYWLTANRSAKPTTAASTRHALTVLRDSGLVVARDNALHSLFHAGPFGYQDCPHSHADHLHIDLTVGLDQLVIDPGTLTYTGHIDARNKLRGCSSHNGPRLLDREFYDPDDPFGWLAKPECLLEKSYATSHASSFGASYRLKYSDGLESEFRRRVIQINGHGWLIQDKIVNSRPHVVAWDFITPGAVEEFVDFIAFIGSDSHLRIRCYPPLPAALRGEVLCSHDYGSLAGARYFRFTTEPVTEVTQNFVVRAFQHLDRSTDDVHKFTGMGYIEFFKGGSVNYTEPRKAEEAFGFNTDASFGAVFNFNGDEAHAFLCDASRLKVENTELFKSQEKVAFADVRIVEGKVTIAVPPGSKVLPLLEMPFEVVELNEKVALQHVRNLRA